MREGPETPIEAAIVRLDWLDAPAEDRKPEGDFEPWLAAPEHCDRQRPGCQGTNDDREIGRIATVAMKSPGFAPGSPFSRATFGTSRGS